MTEPIDQKEEKVMASTWRVLKDPYTPPDLAMLEWRADINGCALKTTVEPEAGGFRHTVTMVKKERL